MGRKIPMWQVFVTILILLVLLFYEIVLAGDEEGHIALVVAAGIAVIFASLNGWKWAYIEKGIINSISRSMQAMLILMTVGMMIGSWIAGGVVPSMIYYGLKILSPGIFLFAACLLCSIVSLATGSSWSTAGTIGVALIGVGMGLDINPAMTAGAVVSGAYFGDKMSPLSDTTNLAPAVAGSNLFDHIRHMVWTVTPSLIVALAVYLFLGFGRSGEADTSQVTIMLDAIKDEFLISPLLLIPPLFVIIAVALRLPALPSLLGGALLGIVCTLFQPNSTGWITWASTLNYGYESINANAEIAELLTGGGMQSMMWTISLIICAMVFGGVMDATDQLKTLAEALLTMVKGRGSLVLTTVVSCIFVNIVACDQYLAIILPGRMYKQAFEDRRLKAKNLSRCLEDSGTVTSNLVPWNTCGATMTGFLGVRQWGPGGYGPFAVLSWFNPLVSIFYGYTGISMEMMTEEEYQKVLEQRELDRELALKAME